MTSVIGARLAYGNCMSWIKKLIPTLVLTTSLAGTGWADTPTVAAVPPGAPEPRNWTLSAALQSYVFGVPVPLLGVELAYHPIDRLAFATRLTTLLIAFDLSAEVRYFILPVQPLSGLYAGVSGHLLTGLGDSGAGGGLELGYERQLPGGVNVAASAGATLLAIESCGCGRPEQTNWRWLPTVSLRMGKSF